MNQLRAAICAKLNLNPRGPLLCIYQSTIASTLFSSLQDIIDDPTSAIALLAGALPSQSAYFIQIILVQNLLALGLELLRLSPVVSNVLRKIASKILGHNLTEKERNETFLGLRTLDDPPEYFFGRELGSKHILVLMVLFVYGCMAPVTSYFTLLVFGLLAIGFRHQFIFVYPVGNDSGGALWIKFTRTSVVCMIVAEIVLFAVLLLNGGFVAAMLMVPLMVSTVLFDIYFKRRHYAVTRYLPLGVCARVDRENGGQETMSQGEWLKDAYLQPALASSSPDNDEVVLELEQKQVPADDDKSGGTAEEAVPAHLVENQRDDGNFHTSHDEEIEIESPFLANFICS